MMQEDGDFPEYWVALTARNPGSNCSFSSSQEAPSHQSTSMTGPHGQFVVPRRQSIEHSSQLSLQASCSGSCVASQRAWVSEHLPRWSSTEQLPCLFGVGHLEHVFNCNHITCINCRNGQGTPAELRN